MNIIFGSENAALVADRYVILELDTVIYGDGRTVDLFCAVDEDLSYDNLVRLDELRHLHALMMVAYRNRGWAETIRFIELLRGMWDGELDTFYDSLQGRCQACLDCNPGDDWSPLVNRR